MEPVEPPWQAIKEWIPDDEPDLTWFNQARKPEDPDPDDRDQSPAWKPEESPSATVAPRSSNHPALG